MTPRGPYLVTVPHSECLPKGRLCFKALGGQCHALRNSASLFQVRLLYKNLAVGSRYSGVSNLFTKEFVILLKLY